MFRLGVLGGKEREREARGCGLVPASHREQLWHQRRALGGRESQGGRPADGRGRAPGVQLPSAVTGVSLGEWW